jgi:hypothetical protein
VIDKERLKAKSEINFGSLDSVFSSMGDKWNSAADVPSGFTTELHPASAQSSVRSDPS